MKLIDMLVEDGMNGWQWPNGHADVTVKRYDAVADDWATAIITREQYEAALAEKEHPLPWDDNCNNDDGWIDWPGGECPVPRDTLVEVKFPDGITSYDAQPAGSYRWTLRNCVTDIAAHRLHKPQEAEQAKADDEVDLNECIGQNAAPVWNGEGQPPVGCECQYRKHKKSEQSEWFTGVVKYASEFTVVIQPVCYPGETVGHPANFEFRPIRSEEDEKRDDRASAIDGFISGFRGQATGSNKELAYALTDYLALLDKL